MTYPLFKFLKCPFLGFLYFEFKTLNQNDLPIRLADFPVGPKSKTLGFRGSSPGFLRIFSAHLEIVLIRNVLPTPPPPVKIIFRVRIDIFTIIKL